MMLAKIKKFATGFGASATLALIGTTSAFAQAGQNIGIGGTNADAGKIQIGAVPILGEGKPLMTIVSNIINIVLIGVGVLAVLYLVYGGVLYVTAGGDAEKANKGRIAITNAIIGIVIIMLSLAIYNFVIKGVGSGEVTK